MFTIRNEQIEALRRAQVADFHARLAGFVAGQFPAALEAMGPGALAASVAELAERALGYGIDAERDVAQFVALGFVLGHSFDVEMPWAREVLAGHPGLGGSARTQLLLRETGRFIEASAAGPDGEGRPG